jgi:hypothetical protein
MHWPGPDERDPRTSESGAIEQTAVQGESLDSPPAEDPSLEELVAQLERDPDECRSAFVGLESLEQETRLTIVRSLRDVPAGPGVVNLLRHLKGSDDEATRESARVVLDELLGLSGLDSTGEERAAGELGLGRGPSAELLPVRAPSGPRPVRCLITAVDGSGRGTIVVSSTLVRERRTAAFLCDLLDGIGGAVGSVEDESAEAGGLIDEVEGRPEVDTMVVPPELARGLLAGCLMLNEPPVPDRVNYWLEATLGAGLRPRPFPGLGEDPTAGEDTDALSLSLELFDACPSWLDDSPLTHELAEEIYLREGRITASPERDAGAFRFLFEHRILRRLELYRRMLLWMAWFWTCAGELELSASARILGAQLADEQYAVPFHPFATVLMSRSLEAAQRRML